MKKIKVFVALLGLVFSTGLLYQPLCAENTSNASGVQWKSWSDDLFTQAQQQNKLVLLDLEAIWCHWCHVMDAETYTNPEVQAILANKFIAVKVDQDSRPDLSNAFQDYGWPATIIFDPQANVLAKRAGFVPAVELKGLLTKLAADPTAEVSSSPSAVGGADTQTVLSALPEDIRTKLVQKHYDSLDLAIGGLKTSHRYLDGDTIEYALSKISTNSEKDVQFLKLSLQNNLKLLDPVWGGVYQYSTGSNWDSPHFEKIMSSQANNIRLYSMGYAAFADEAYLTAAQNVFGYLNNFLKSSEGAFYTSQDADVVRGQHSEEYFKLNDQQRRARGIPAIDKNIYTRENGLAISAITNLYASNEDPSYLEVAVKAARWVIQKRKLAAGGFRHGETDSSGPYLSDNLAMARAFLSLYVASADREWLQQSRATADFIIDNFTSGKPSDPGFFSLSTKVKSVIKAKPELTLNIEVARLLNLLSHYSGDQRYKTQVMVALSYLGRPEIALENINNSGILLADAELNSSPLHITVVAKKDDPEAKKLYAAGLKYFSTYKRLEWWDKREGPMPNSDVSYPELPKAAAFICTNSRCSLPIFAPDKLLTMIATLSKK